MVNAQEKTASREGECGVLGKARGFQVVRDILPVKAIFEQRSKEKGVTWTFGARLFQAEGIAHAKALR